MNVLLTPAAAIYARAASVDCVNGSRSLHCTLHDTFCNEAAAFDKYQNLNVDITTLAALPIGCQVDIPLLISLAASGSPSL